MSELERRQFLSAVPPISSFPATSTTLYAAVPGATNLTVGANGDAWYTANGKLENLTINGRTAKSSIKASIADKIASVVSNIDVSGSATIWFAVAATDGTHLGKLTANNQFREISAVSDTRTGNLTVSAGHLWFTRGANEIDGVDADGRKTTVVIPNLRAVTGISASDDGRVWFIGTNLNGVGVAGIITSDGSVKTFPLPIIPTSVTAEELGHVFVGGANAIERISADGTVVKTAIAVSAPRNLTITGDGSVWFMNDSGTREIIQLANDGTSKRYVVPVPESASITSLSIAPDGKLWFTATSESAGWLGILNTHGSPRSTTPTTRPGTGTENGESAVVCSFSDNMRTPSGDRNTFVATPTRSKDDGTSDQPPKSEPLRTDIWAGVTKQSSTEKGSRVIHHVDDPGTFEGEFALSTLQSRPPESPKDSTQEPAPQVEPALNTLDEYSSNSPSDNAIGAAHADITDASDVSMVTHIPAAISYVANSLPVASDPITAFSKVTGSALQLSACVQTQYTFNSFHLSSAPQRRKNVFIGTNVRQDEPDPLRSQKETGHLSKVSSGSTKLASFSKFAVYVSAAGGLYSWQRRSEEKAS
ncbi:MAG TPA: hypothetical protein VM008_17465 [Phycisphaerae bacterium]|nr:hypothetical protein [Phycisphaerae bacterium]